MKLFTRLRAWGHQLTVFLFIAFLPLIALADPLSYQLKSPIKSPSLQQLIIDVLGILITLLTPIVVIFIVLAGFKYVTARGDASKTKDATRALTYAIIGGILIIGAIAISRIIGGIVSEF